MSLWRASDVAVVALQFPDDFPFDRRRAQAEPAAPAASQAHANVTEAQPMPAPIPPPSPVFSSMPVATAQSLPERARVPADLPARSATHVQAMSYAKSQALAPAAPTVSRRSERRRSPRQTLVAKAVIRSEATQTTVATGFISNISMLGVGFHTRRGLAIGEKYQLRVEVGPMKWSTRLRVVSCQPHESGTYDVGAEFVGSDLSARALREIAA